MSLMMEVDEIASLIEIIINADDRASHKFDQVSRNAKRMQAIIAAITLGAAAFTPALLGGLGAIASMFGTAGLAAAGFGALATTTIMKAWSTASDLEDAMLDVNAAMINNDAKGYAKAMAKVQAIWDSMTDSEKRAVMAINEFKSEWQDMEIQMSPVTLDLMAEALHFLTLSMTGMFPAMKRVGESFVGMFAHMNQAIESGRVDPFFRYMNAYAVPHFERVMLSAGNILKGFAGLMVSFTPIGLEFGTGMVNMTQKFSDWAWGLQSSTAFQDFCNMVRTNTPIIFQLMGTIVDVIWQIIVTLNPITMKILLLADAFLRWAMESGALDIVLRIIIGALQLLIDNANWLVPLLASLYLGFKALQIIQTVARGFDLLSKAGGLLLKGLNWLIPATRGMTTAQIALNAAQLFSPHMWLIAGIAALISVGVLLWKNWDEIAKFAKYLWSEIKKSWNGIKTDVVEAYDKMVSKTSEWWSETKQKWNETIDTVKSKTVEMYNDVVTKYHDMKEGAKSKLTEMVNDAKIKWNNLTESAWGGATSMWKAGVENARSFKEGLSSKLDGLGSMMWEGINDMWKSIKSWGTTFYNSGKGLLSEFADGIWSGIEKAYDNLWEGLKSIRKLLPFSPAKEGPLSDLDKSGKAFFPTWYEAAMSQVGSMQRSIAGAFAGVASEADVALAGTGLEAFTGGATKFTMEIVHKHKGSVKVDGSDLADFEAQVNQTVAAATSRTNYGFDRVSLRKI